MARHRTWALFLGGMMTMAGSGGVASGEVKATAAAATPSGALAALCDEYWQGFLAASPTFATSIGDTRFDDRLDDNSPAGRERDRKRLEGVLSRARALDANALPPADRLTRAALVEEVESQLAQIDCHFEDWVVDPLNGPQVEFMNLPDYTSVKKPEDARKYVTRVRAMGRYVDQHVANLGAGLASGRVATREAVRKTLDQLQALAAQPVEKWALMGPLAGHEDWPAAESQALRQALAAAVRDSVAPAFVRYAAFLDKQALPAARPPEKAGLVALPGGVECYRKRIRSQTSLDLSPQEIHQLGLAEVARFREELAKLGQKVLGTSDVAEIQKRLRSDPAMHFRTAEEVEAKAREALARAERGIPAWFGVLPKARCEVKVMGMHEAPQSTIAYYRQPAADGSRPGFYMINTYKPETRPRYEAEALAFHESIPGHHLQIAIAQELKGMPEFRKHLGVTAFVEGWALYTERLSDEMGLYTGDLDRIGMLSYDAWRGCRLVVDTGLHAMGWSRQQAIDYMLANSVLAENNIENEVDRYITWPGQALAYKLGQIEILKLREEARKKLGARFDIKAFHDVVLRDGAVALPVLRQQVEAWIARAGVP
jgi:uncharacterized protein (DUF885 family)